MAPPTGTPARRRTRRGPRRRANYGSTALRRPSSILAGRCLACVRGALS